MARNAAQRWNDILKSTDELPASTLADAGLGEGSDIDVGDQQDDSDTPLDVVDAPNVGPPVQGRAPIRAQLDRAWVQSGDDELRRAHRADAKQSAIDSASDALYSAFSRRPLQKFSNSPSQADALLKRMGLERQGRQDAAAEDLQKAKIAKMGQAKKPGQYKVIEELFSLPAGSMDGLDSATAKTIASAITSGNTAKAKALADEAARTHQNTRDEADRTFRAGESVKDRISRERAAALSAGAKVDDKTAAEVRGLGTDLAGTASLKDAFAQVDSARVASPGAGTGRWDSWKWDVFNSKEDTQVKQALKQIVAVVLKRQSGATVSEDELKRTLDSYGIGPGSSEAAFAPGYAALKNAAVASAKEAEAKQSPKAVETYRSRGGTTSADFATPVPPGANLDTPGPKAPVSYMVSPDRKRRVPKYADGTLGPEEAMP